MVLRHRPGRPAPWMLVAALVAGLALVASFTWVQCRQADRAAETAAPAGP